jgi:uncharacterized protein YuzE
MKLLLENAQCPECMEIGMRTFLDITKLGDITGLNCLHCGNAYSKEEIEEFNEGTFDEDDD